MQEYELKLLYTAVTRCRSLLIFAEPDVGMRNAEASTAARRWLTADSKAHNLGKMATEAELEALYNSSKAASAQDILEVAADLASAARTVVQNSGFLGQDEDGRNPRSLFQDAILMFKRSGTERGSLIAARIEGMLQVYEAREALAPDLDAAVHNGEPSPGATVCVIGPRDSEHVGRYARVAEKITWAGGRIKVLFAGGSLQLDQADLQVCIVNPALEARLSALARQAWEVGMLDIVEELVQRAAFFEDDDTSWAHQLLPLETWVSRATARRAFLQKILYHLHSHSNGLKIGHFTSPIAPGVELRPMSR